jgi:L-2,4-diaminobutyric acid acetyltransferase
MSTVEIARPTDTRSNRGIEIQPPIVDDGVELWRLASESKVLDVNSRYAYLLWCRDFADTTVIARRSGSEEPALGFVTGYRRPEVPDTLFVWQVAVDERARGEGLAGRMLDSLVEGADDVHHLETTITPDNEASIALFTKFAERWDAEVERKQLFDEELLGDDHLPENRFRIGPFRSRGRLRSAS